MRKDRTSSMSVTTENGGEEEREHSDTAGSGRVSLHRSWTTTTTLIILLSKFFPFFRKCVSLVCVKNFI